MKSPKLRPRDILIVCKTNREHFDMLALIVHIQAIYRKKMFKTLKIDLPDGRDLIRICNQVVKEYIKLKREIC